MPRGRRVRSMRLRFILGQGPGVLRCPEQIGFRGLGIEKVESLGVHVLYWVHRFGMTVITVQVLGKYLVIKGLDS